MSDLTASDVMALTNNDNWQNNPFIYLVWLALLGNGNFFGRGYDNSTQNAITRSDLFEGFNNQDVNSQLRGIANGLCDGFYAMNNGIKDGVSNLGSAIAENRFSAQQEACGIRSEIKDLAAEEYKNTCKITTAIHEEGEATRSLITQNTIQELRDRLDEKDRLLQSAQFQLSQQAQNAYLINAVRPFPQPAYITTSPYTTNNNNCSVCGQEVKAMISAYTNTNQTVASMTPVVFNNAPIDKGCAESFIPGGSSFTINRPGYYEITFTGSGVESGTAGVITNQLYVNGEPKLDALASAYSGGSGVTINLHYSTFLRVLPNCPVVNNIPTNITFQNTGVGATYSNVAATIRKIA